MAMQPGPHDLVLALVVELSEDQLTVGAIHRTISGLPADFDLVAALGEWFDLVRAGAADERTLTALADSNSLALVTGGQAFLLLPHADLVEQEGNDLDSNLVATVLAGLPPHEVMHRHSFGRGPRGALERRGSGGFPAAAADGQADRELGERPKADAPQDDVLQPEAAHGHGLPVPRHLLRS